MESSVLRHGLTEVNGSGTKVNHAKDHLLQVYPDMVNLTVPGHSLDHSH